MKVLLFTLCRATGINRDVEQNLESILGTAERASHECSNGLKECGQPPLAGFRQEGRDHCITTIIVTTTEGDCGHVIAD